MIRITLSENEIKQVLHDRFEHPHPHVQKKMEVIWLKHLKYSHEQIGQIVCLSKATITRYLNCYINNGLSGLRAIKFYKPESRLTKFSGTIKDYFEANPPATINEGVSIIEELTGIKRSDTQVRKFLKSIGMKRLKVSGIPAKANTEEQEEYKKNIWILA